MTTRHTIHLVGPGTRGTRVSGSLLRQLLNVVGDAMQQAVRLRVEGRSTAPGQSPAWLERAVQFEIVGFETGSTAIVIDAPSLLEAAPQQFSQAELFSPIDPTCTAFDVMNESLADAMSSDANSDRYDDVLAGTLENFGRLFQFQIESVSIDAAQSVMIDASAIDRIRKTRNLIPAPQRSIIAGTLDEIRHSDRAFKLVLEGGGSVRGVVTTEAIASRELARFFGRKVAVEGQAHFRPSGTPLRIDAERLTEASAADLAVFSAPPMPLGGELEIKALARTQGPRSGVAAIFGQWPGDETDEEFEAAVREIS